jgi:hypothetical protein
MRLSTAEIGATMIEALQGVNSVMEKVNANMDIHSIQEVLKEFAKQSEKMEMQQEMVSPSPNNPVCRCRMPLTWAWITQTTSTTQTNSTPRSAMKSELSFLMMSEAGPKKAKSTTIRKPPP